MNFTNGNQASFLGGGQIGGNYQIGAFVIGAEADFDWFANNNNSGNGTTVVIGGVPTALRASANDRWETTLAARFGYAWDHTLFYGKAGGGWVGADNFAVTNVGTGASLAVTNGNSNVGWLLGAGFEYAFTPNWTAKVEYDYLALNNASHNVTLPIPASSTLSPTAVVTSRRSLSGSIICSTSTDVRARDPGSGSLFSLPRILLCARVPIIRRLKSASAWQKANVPIGSCA